MHTLHLKPISADIVADIVNPIFRYSLLVLIKVDIASILQSNIIRVHVLVLVQVLVYAALI